MGQTREKRNELGCFRFSIPGERRDSLPVQAEGCSNFSSDSPEIIHFTQMNRQSRCMSMLCRRAASEFVSYRSRRAAGFGSWLQNRVRSLDT